MSSYAIVEYAARAINNLPQREFGRIERLVRSAIDAARPGPHSAPVQVKLDHTAQRAAATIAGLADDDINGIETAVLDAIGDARAVASQNKPFDQPKFSTLVGAQAWYYERLKNDAVPGDASGDWNAGPVTVSPDSMLQDYQATNPKLLLHDLRPLGVKSRGTIWIMPRRAASLALIEAKYGGDL